MRCISAFLLSLTLALSLTACSSAPKADTSTRPEEPPAETPEPANSRADGAGTLRHFLPHR